MSDYDVGKAFARIEREIIASMMRNMENHKTEEDKEGKKWPQWQAMQLKSLEKFKRDNRKKYDFTKINSTIDGLIQEAYDKGGMEEEIRILKQIKRLHGNSVTNVVKAKISDIKQRLTPGVNQEFFGLNREKVDKLIKATHSDMEKVEHAMLRRADDQYRKIIFNAQMADISGAFTYEQAVDMAAKDFLNAGLNCVEYKNGRKVTAKTYAEMAIRTANARATLMAEGDKRHQLGITTVIVGHNGSACPLCAKWLGKVLIDDVYSGGKPTDGDYPLLSTAMKEGLFHPNCRDVIGTYIPGITRLPEPPKPEERQLSFDVYNLEQKEKQAKHNAERMGRLGDNSLEQSNKKKYKHREKMWKEKVEEYEKEKSQYLRNNLPKKYVDKRNVGQVIDEKDLQRIYIKAESYGIRIQGFETYCGDVQVLDNIIEYINKSNSKLLLRGKRKDIILNYDNVLGYEGDNSMIDIGAFAETRGKTITLNKFMFDDSDYLVKEYQDSLYKKYFAPGTSYLNIFDHEYGHILDKNNPYIYKKVLDEINKRAYNKGESVHKFINDNISRYAKTINDKGDYSELIAELYSMANGSEREFALDIFRKAGVLYEN